MLINIVSGVSEEAFLDIIFSAGYIVSVKKLIREQGGRLIKCIKLSVSSFFLIVVNLVSV